MKKTSLIAALALTTAAFSAPVLSQNYPERPIRFIVGFVPGGSADFTARAIADKLSDVLKQPIQIENRAGAGGTLAHELVMRAKPDGHTMVLASIGPMAINHYLYDKMTFDPLKDFAPVSLLVNVTPLMAVHPSLPAKNAKEFVTFLKSKPNQISFGSSGVGSANHMAGELLGSMLKSKMIHVSARGAADAITNLKVGQVQVIYAGITALKPLMEQKQIRGIAVTTSKRSLLVPEIPTLAESSPELKNYEANNWYGIAVTGGTPRSSVDKLNQALRATLNDAETKKKLLENGLEPNPTSPEEFIAYLKNENAKWGKVIRENNIRVK